MTHLPAVPGPEQPPRRGLLGRVTGAVTERALDVVPPDLLLEHIDVDALLDRIDVNKLLDRVDPDRLLDRVDPDRLLDRVDPDRLLARVDVDRIVARVDLNAILETVDLEGLVRRSGIPDIVAESTGALAGSALDVARRQIVGLDAVLERLVDRILRRDPASRTIAPVLLRDHTPTVLVDDLLPPVLRDKEDPA